jgi:hypothetical protein
VVRFFIGSDHLEGARLLTRKGISGLRAELHCQRPIKKQPDLPSNLVIASHCNCGHEWVPVFGAQKVVSREMRVQRPAICPSYKSPDWNKPPREKKGKY